MDFKTGGQKVILRLVEAYGFSTRQMLCDHLGVSKSTLATRFMRDIFPAEWVIQCALETGASLKWLTSGNGVMFENKQLDILEIPKKKVIQGKLYEAGCYFLDKITFSENIMNPSAIADGENIYIVEPLINDVNDGKWLVDIDSNISIRDIILLPGRKLMVANGKSSFECSIDEIKILAQIKITIHPVNSN